MRESQMGDERVYEMQCFVCAWMKNISKMTSNALLTFCFFFFFSNSISTHLFVHFSILFIL